MPKHSDPFCRQYAPRTPDSDINAEIEAFLASGGKVKKLRTPDKNFRETPREKVAVFLSDREERLLAD